MTNWAKMTGFAAMLAVALAGSLHWGLYYPSPISGPQSVHETDDYVTEAFTGILAVATLALMFATTGLVFLSQRQIKDSRVIQRAYVKASPPAPGIEFGLNDTMNVTIEIRNHGVTPGRVTDLVVTGVIFPNGQDLPAVPPYTRYAAVRVAQAFLVANDFVTARSLLQIPGVSKAALGECQLCIFGYVDYIDQFGQRYRAGWGRSYDHTREGMKLVYVTEQGYNYDRLRVPEEGIDWKEKS